MPELDLIRLHALLEEPLTDANDHHLVADICRNAGVDSGVAEKLIRDQLPAGDESGRKFLRDLLKGRVYSGGTLQRVTADDLTNANGRVESLESRLKEAKKRQNQLQTAIWLGRQFDSVQAAKAANAANTAVETPPAEDQKPPAEDQKPPAEENVDSEAADGRSDATSAPAVQKPAEAESGQNDANSAADAESDGKPEAVAFEVPADMRLANGASPVEVSRWIAKIEEETGREVEEVEPGDDGFLRPKFSLTAEELQATGATVGKIDVEQPADAEQPKPAEAPQSIGDDLLE